MSTNSIINTVPSSIFIINGHGQEAITNINMRKRLPEGYTLVTFAECGNVSYLQKTIDKVVTAFLNPDSKDILDNPHISELKTLFGNQNGEETIHIYHEGDAYPELSCELFLDWQYPSDRSKHLVVKSGLYRFPLKGEKSEYIKQKVINVVPGSLKYFKSESDDLDKIIDLYTDSILPTKNDVNSILSTRYGRYMCEFRKAVQYPIEKLFEAGGPGVYYWPICRSVMESSSKKLEDYTMKFDNAINDSWLITDPRTIYLTNMSNRYKKYLYEWIDKYDKVKPLMNENASNPDLSDKLKGKLKKIRKELNNTYEKVHTIRRKSVNLHGTRKGGHRKRKTRRCRKLKYVK